TALTIVGERESDTTPFATFVAAGTPKALTFQNAPSVGTEENDLFGAATDTDGTTWAVGWNVDPVSGNFATLVEHGTAGTWSVDTRAGPGTGERGPAGTAATPGGGLGPAANEPRTAVPATLIEYHP